MPPPKPQLLVRARFLFAALVLAIIVGVVIVDTLLHTARIPDSARHPFAVGGAVQVPTRPVVADDSGAAQAHVDITAASEASEDSPPAATWEQCLSAALRCRGSTRDTLAQCGTLLQRKPPRDASRVTAQRNRPRAQRELRVACVGDSITYGNGTHVARKERDFEGSYPLELQAAFDRNSALPFKVAVLNYAKSGRTAGDIPEKFSFRRSPEFDQSLRSEPHVVMLMLGTNDSKNRTWAGVAEFEKDIDFFISKYRALPTRPAIVLMSPPPALSFLGRIRYEIIRNDQLPALRRLSQQLHTGFVDVFGALSQLLPRDTVPPKQWPLGRRAFVNKPRPPGADLLHDGVHPTIVGHQAIAAAVVADVCGSKADA